MKVQMVVLLALQLAFAQTTVEIKTYIQASSSLAIKKDGSSGE